MGKRADIKETPSLELLFRFLAYDPSTGVFMWKHRDDGSVSSNAFNRRHGAGPAGTVTSRGYLTIGIKTEGKLRYYLAHRLAWKFMTGTDAVAQVDHVDGMRLNNKWNNLRSATHGQNRQNSKMSINNKSGIKGVCWDSGHKAWVAYIGADGTQTRLGRFKTIADAAKARMVASQMMHGDFARSA